MDGSTPFPSYDAGGMVPAANDVVGGLIVLLVTAARMGEVKDEVKDKIRKNVVVAGFQGEGYGGMGSRR